MALDVQKERAVVQLETLMKGTRLHDNNKSVTLYDVFNDELTTDLMVNPDNCVFVDKLHAGMYPLGTINPATTKSIINIVAGYHDYICNSEHPICEGEFPSDKSRFEGCLPPVVENASFVLRKKATKIFTLDDYVKAGIISERQRDIISKSTINKKNILIVGGTGSGKTTLINAVIKELEENTNDRILIIEDTGEIQCSAKNKVQLHTSPMDHIYMTDLLKVALRYRPDRIIVGEVRGPEALDLLDSWNTGHSGGLATLHSNTALSALDRLNQLVTRNPCHPADIDKIIGEAVDLVINITRTSSGRTLKDIIKINYFNSDTRKYEYEFIK